MVSSPNNSGFAQQLEATRQRLASIRDRLLIQSGLSTELQASIAAELQSALTVLQTAQTVIQQTLRLPEIEALLASLHEKDVLLREIHHRLKNNLQVVSSLLDLQALRIEDPMIQALLRSNQSRISAIALVHEQLYQSSNLAAINLGEYVQNLSALLLRTYAIESQVILRTEINAAVEVSPERATPVGLILNELVTNALKHGLNDQAGEIRVVLRLEPDQQILLSVSDTGQGFPLDWNLTESRSLGFQLITSLVQQIDGQLSITRSQQPTITIRFDAVGSA